MLDGDQNLDQKVRNELRKHIDAFFRKLGVARHARTHTRGFVGSHFCPLKSDDDLAEIRTVLSDDDAQTWAGIIRRRSGT